MKLRIGAHSCQSSCNLHQQWEHFHMIIWFVISFVNCKPSGLLDIHFHSKCTVVVLI